MKNSWKTIRWLTGQARNFMPPIFLIIVLGSSSSLFSVGMAIASKNMIDAAVALEKNKAVAAAIVFAAFILVDVGLQALISIISANTYEALSNRIRQNLFARLSNTIWMDFTRYHSDDILTRMTSDVGVIANGIVNILPEVLSLGVLLVAAFGTLLYYDPVLAVLAFILSPVSILFSRIFGRRLKQQHIKIQETESAYRAFIHESIQNMLVVKAFGLEEESRRRIGTLQTIRLSWVMRRSRMSAAANSVLSLGYWLGYFLAFAWGALRLSKGTASFGTLTAFLQLVEHIQRPFVGLAYAFPGIVSTLASTGRLMEFETLEVENRDGKLPDWTSVGIRLDNVSFAYEKDKPVLSNASAYICPGETVALMGPSGEGKTTVIRLLLSLIRPDSGQISFTDGRNGIIDVCALSREWVSYVPQGNTLFSGTIAENLRAGLPKADDSELEAAARAACAWEFIEELPEGLNTGIGERGHGLSEGQAQRIAIARALLRNAPVLILDEATSALDAAAEMHVLKSIHNLSPARTCLIITHRKSALDMCQRVLSLEDGRLVENL